MLQLLPVILEAQEYFSLKLLLIHADDQFPRLMTTGKIAGIRHIPVHDLYKTAGEKTFIGKVFEGSVEVHVARLLPYALGFLLVFMLFFALVAIPTFLGQEAFNNWKRKKVIRGFRKTSSINLNETDEYLFRRYLEGGYIVLWRLEKNFMALPNSTTIPAPEELKMNMYERLGPDLGDLGHETIRECVEAGILNFEGGHYLPATHVMKTLDHFIRYIRNTVGVKKTREKEKHYRRTLEIRNLHYPIDLDEEKEEVSVEGKSDGNSEVGLPINEDPPKHPLP